MQSDFYVDIHCHPSIKPYGQSFTGNKKSGLNNSNRKKNTSTWYYNPPSLFDKLLNKLISVTKFSQSDFSTGAYGGVRVVCASLYPVERSFCHNKLGKSLLADLPVDFVTGFGKHRIDAVQNFNSAAYFADLQAEYTFLKQLDNHEVVLTDNRRYRYKLVNNYSELEQVLQYSNDQVDTIAVIVSIEGAHALGCGIDNNASFDTLNTAITTIKNWEYPPFFITLAHHFYNELCGHAESLTSGLKKIADQSDGLDTGITPLGEKVLHSLLDTHNGKRILIDIKHMSRKARDRYFEILRTDYNNSVPIIVSHGCVQGNVKDAHKFNNGSINFSDEDLIYIAKTRGLFGLQLDERRIGSTSLLQFARSFTKRSKVLFHWAELVWNQIQHIAEVLDAEGLFAWECMCLGTDFDGIIDPINGYWTHEDMPDLETYLLMHAHNYLQSKPPLQTMNIIHEEEIVSRIMGSNATEFFKRNFV